MSLVSEVIKNMGLGEKKWFVYIPGKRLQTYMTINVIGRF